MSETFTAIRISKPGDYSTITVEQLPFPELKPGEVLVKVEYSTINPSDLAKAAGRYPVGPPPFTLGSEGSGTVVKSGGGEVADSLLNKHVAVGGVGTWAEYIVVHSLSVFPLLDSVPLEQAASLIVNPMSVALIIEKVQQDRHPAIIQNAAASALGKMLIKWGKILNIPTINLVRRQEQVDTLKAIGAEHVFNTSEEGWKQSAKELASSLGATIAIDYIAGTSTTDIADLLNDGGIVYNFGGLSGEPCKIGMGQLLMHNIRLEGLWLSPWLISKTHEERVQTGFTVQNLLEQVFKTDYAKEVTLSQIKEALHDYSKNATNNKYLIRTKLSS